MMRRLIVMLSLAAVVLFGAAPAQSQTAELAAAAKKEGKVVVYGSLESDTTAAIMKAFKEKTGIEASYWRGSATKVMDRALSESRAGRPLFDIILTNSNPMQLMEKQGLFTAYHSPSDAEFPKDVVDPVLGPRYRNVIIGVVYNTGAIKASDAPKSLEDLVKPEYRGKLVMADPTLHTTTAQWLASLYKIMGKEKSENFVRALSATNPVLVESLLPAAKRVTTGETPIAVTYVKYAYIFGKQGAPLDYVRSPEMLGDGHYITLSKRAPHPNAGKAFIDFFLGSESMKMMAQLGEFVNMKGVYPPLPGADKIRFVQMDDFTSQQFAKLRTQYGSMFHG